MSKIELIKEDKSMFKTEDVCVKFDIEKKGNMWVELTTEFEIIDNDWVSQYIGDYEEGSKVRMSLVESKDGLFRFKCFEDGLLGFWVWSFKSFPKNEPHKWTPEQLEKHSTCAVFGYRLIHMWARNPYRGGGFRADVYFEDI